MTDLARLFIAAAKARRSGLIANNGIHCRTAAEVAYYNARDVAPRDADGRIIMTDELRAMKDAAQ